MGPDMVFNGAPDKASWKTFTIEVITLKKKAKIKQDMTILDLSFTRSYWNVGRRVPSICSGLW